MLTLPALNGLLTVTLVPASPSFSHCLSSVSLPFIPYLNLPYLPAQEDIKPAPDHMHVYIGQDIN